MLREIDTRTIPGNGGRVVWELWDGENGLADPCHLVHVWGAGDQHIITLDSLTPQEALDAFLHTFARPDVPDVFARTADVQATA